MRTVIIILSGLLLLGVCVLAGRLAGGAGAGAMVASAKIFLPIWLVAALINMWVGVSRAGYSVAEELPIFLVIFAIPAAVAAFLWWKFS
jgi:hypothetical protein